MATLGESNPLEGRLIPSHARMVVVPSVDDVLAEIRGSLVFATQARRTVTIELNRLPEVNAQIDHVLEELAEVALSLWPNWYRGAIPADLLELQPRLPRRRLGDETRRIPVVRCGLSLAWLEAARSLCRIGRIPLPPGFVTAIQARQLGLAIEPEELLLVLCIKDPSAESMHLFGLSRSAEWLARETGASALVLVPEPLARTIELDGISSGAIWWVSGDRPEPPSLPREATYRIWPIQGQPHPYSPGEQLLAQRLAKDNVLGPLFAFNQRVRTRFQSDYLVDLLSAEAKLIVEVDGYEHHANRYAFSLDRRRDYELIISGYLVLRLPHDEVMEDVELPIEKIRDVVRFRQASHLETKAQSP
jgi:very-short-patch-repair endonuclease